MKLTTTTMVTVDGVMQGLGGPDEDSGADSSAADGSRRCSTTRPGRFSTRSTSAPTRSCSADGPTRSSPAPGERGQDPGDNPIWTALNTKPKYVASTTLTDPQWANTTVLSGDVAAAIGELKAKPAGELQVHGSGKLIRWLLENDLVDEMNLLICPVVVGQGTRLFPDTGPDIALELVESRSTPNGVTIQVYRPTGRPQYATGHRRLKHVK